MVFNFAAECPVAHGRSGTGQIHQSAFTAFTLNVVYNICFIITVLDSTL